MVEERLGKRRTNPAEAIRRVRGIVLPRPPPRMMSCVRRLTKVLSARLFFARGVSRVRASCTVPRLRVRPLVSHNENLNSPKQLI